MKRRLSNRQINSMNRLRQAGLKTPVVVRKYGISNAVFWKYKANFGGMIFSNARRLRALEAVNARLKGLLAADNIIDNPALKHLTRRNF